MSLFLESANETGKVDDRESAHNLVSYPFVKERAEQIKIKINKAVLRALPTESKQHHMYIWAQ